MKIKIHGISIMPALVHGYESWSVTVRVLYSLSIFESRALREIHEARWREGTGGLTKFHNGEIDDI